MNKTYSMASPLDDKARSQAGMITGGFVLFMILLMIFVKWRTMVYEPITQDVPIDVEISLPPDPPVPPVESPAEEGGGGGGNPVMAGGPAGTADYTPSSPSKEMDEEDTKDAPEVTRPKAVEPKAIKHNEESVAKTEPKPVVTPPAPKPKTVMSGGMTTGGNNRGGGAAEDYAKAGGSGNGTGVGRGDGTGGGTGNGNGGGNGNGNGSGSGPRIMGGDRKIVRHYSFDGDLEKAVVYANISVSPDGVGRFLSIAKGSSNSNAAYKNAIVQYLQNIRFDKADHESMLTVQFNFRVN